MRHPNITAFSARPAFTSCFRPVLLLKRAWKALRVNTSKPPLFPDGTTLYNMEGRRYVVGPDNSLHVPDGSYPVTRPMHLFGECPRAILVKDTKAALRREGLWRAECDRSEDAVLELILNDFNRWAIPGEQLTVFGSDLQSYLFHFSRRGDELSMPGVYITTGGEAVFPVGVRFYPQLPVARFNGKRIVKLIGS